MDTRAENIMNQIDILINTTIIDHSKYVCVIVFSLQILPLIINKSKYIYIYIYIYIGEKINERMAENAHLDNIHPLPTYKEGEKNHVHQI